MPTYRSSFPNLLGDLGVSGPGVAACERVRRPLRVGRHLSQFKRERRGSREQAMQLFRDTVNPGVLFGHEPACIKAHLVYNFTNQPRKYASGYQP